jgi:hypothetical protein
LVWRPHVVVSTPKRIKCCWEAIRPRWQREPQSPVRRLPMRSQQRFRIVGAAEAPPQEFQVPPS